MVPFHSFSPVLETPRAGPEFWSAPRLSNLVCFLPLLEDLDVKGFVIDNDDTNFQPSTSPPLTGTLRLRFRRWIGSATRQLLDLPNGVRFRKLDFTWFHESGLQCASAALEACSDTIECVSIRCGSHGKFYSFCFLYGPVITRVCTRDSPGGFDRLV